MWRGHEGGSGGSSMEEEEEEAAGGRVLLSLPGVSLPLSLSPRLLRGRLRILQGPRDLELQWEPLEEPWDSPGDPAPPDPGFEPDWAVLSPPRTCTGWAGGFGLCLGELRGLRRSPPGLSPPTLLLLPRGGTPGPPPLHLPRGGLPKILRTLGSHLRPCPGDPRLLLLATPEDPPEPRPSPSLVTRWLQGPCAATLGGLSRILGGPRGGAGPEPEVEPEVEPPFEIIACVRLGPRPSPIRGPPLAPAEWGRGLKPEELRERIFRGGLSPELRARGWRLLLGLEEWGDPEGTPENPERTPKSPEGSPKNPEGIPKISEGTPETSEGIPKNPEGTPKSPEGTPKTPEGIPKNPKETPKSPEGTPKSPERIPKISEGIPKRIGWIPKTEQARRDDYFRMKLQWRSLSPGQLRRNKILRGYRDQLEREVTPELLRDVLMTFCVFHWDLGYVRGMNEVLSALVGVAPDEAETFWEFCRVMDMVGENFGPGPEGLNRKLGELGALVRVVNPELSPLLELGGPRRFCSQWLQFRFQRQLGLEGTRRLWEVLWTGLPCPNFHLLVTCALLELLGDSLGDIGDSDSDGDTASQESCGDKVSPVLLEAGQVLSRAEGMFLQLESATGLPPALQELLGLGPPP